jgi:hypothetical protein
MFMLSMRQSIISILTLALLLAFLFHACQPDDVSPQVGQSKARLAIRLTDDPGDYQQVNIDLQQVRANMVDSSGIEAWYDLATNAGIYDLLTLQNGLDTLIVNDSLPPGQLQQLRLVLGNNNTVMVDSSLYEMKVPSGSSSGLKINVQQTLVQDSLSTLLLDFDAKQSVVARGNGGFNLKPVIRVLP